MNRVGAFWVFGAGSGVAGAALSLRFFPSHYLHAGMSVQQPHLNNIGDNRQQAHRLGILQHFVARTAGAHRWQ